METDRQIDKHRNIIHKQTNKIHTYSWHDRHTHNYTHTGHYSDSHITCACRGLKTIFLSQSVADSPFDLTLSRTAMDVLLVSWTAPSQTVTGYVIYYQQDGGERISMSVEASATSYTITGLNIGATYSISMVATSNTLPSNIIGPQMITLGTSRGKC